VRENGKERQMNRTSFERFYLRNVLNEGCGCAEQIIGTRELERRLQDEALKRGCEDAGGESFGWLRRLFCSGSS
jgi:hypothetical protein